MSYHIYHECDSPSDLADRAMFRLEKEEKLATWRNNGEKCTCGKPIEFWEFLYLDKCRECRAKNS